MTETLGQRLRKLRRGRKLTLVEVGAAIDKSRSFINELEIGKKQGTHKTLADLASFYGVTLDYLQNGASPEAFPLARIEMHGEPPYSREEKAIVGLWRSLDLAKRDAWLALLEQSIPSTPEID
ncbi:helix-turn-helix domain-containing protein [Acetobacter musti]|uniref:Helix-turn-helix domain-containing protein n=1 Tax=Acetobacter musti TaxID=864732 RepID=A0ABX0JK67_9PROT|nr:helix-turn-helix transcriptional regulator [Acetobacter musti]NHN83642.1 helix-turn-helix domain-containing protein [Acetobacter musti]